MKTTILPLATILVLTFTSCVPSLHPLFSEGDLDFDEALVGKWSNDDETSIWHFEANEKETYLLTLTDGKHEGKFRAALVKVGENRYLNIFPAEVNAEEHQLNGLYAWLLVPTHTFLKVRQIEPDLQISFLNYDAVDSLLETLPDAVPHTKPNERTIFTGSTEELQAFLRKYDKEDNLFKDFSKLRKYSD